MEGFLAKERDILEKKAMKRKNYEKLKLKKT